MIEDLFLSHPMTVLIGAILLSIALVVGVHAVPSYFAQEHTCAKKASVLQTDYRFGFWEGCWVKQKNGAWVEYNTIRNVGVTTY